HTRLSRDWSSDVCSSDLYIHLIMIQSNSSSPSAYASGRVMSEDLQTNIRATAEFVAACVAEPLSAEDFALMLGYNMASPVHARESGRASCRERAKGEGGA